MIFQPDEVPGLPNHDRILVKVEQPKETTEGGLIIPDSAQTRASFGVILAAGLDARDKMHDNGHEVGDYIWFGKFAGCLEQWDHFTSTPDPTCQHDWCSTSAPALCRAFKCDKCGVGRIQEPLLVMSVDDILLNEDLGRRLGKGEMRIKRARNMEGQTTHIIERAPFTANGTTTTMEVSNVTA